MHQQLLCVLHRIDIYVRQVWEGIRKQQAAELLSSGC